mmetsp:Transcript_74152/g.211681  ORF Transcript_74152/g.211681 Transcript_74152/m.211681 type:complete len:122 (-) Transcript_74152:1077-1442(-)
MVMEQHQHQEYEDVRALAKAVQTIGAELTIEREAREKADARLVQVEAALAEVVATLKSLRKGQPANDGTAAMAHVRPAPSPGPRRHGGDAAGGTEGRDGGAGAGEGKGDAAAVRDGGRRRW